MEKTKDTRRKSVSKWKNRHYDGRTTKRDTPLNWVHHKIFTSKNSSDKLKIDEPIYKQKNNVCFIVIDTDWKANTRLKSKPNR